MGILSTPKKYPPRTRTSTRSEKIISNSRNNNASKANINSKPTKKKENKNNAKTPQNRRENHMFVTPESSTSFCYNVPKGTEYSQNQNNTHKYHNLEPNLHQSNSNLAYNDKLNEIEVLHDALEKQKKATELKEKENMVLTLLLNQKKSRYRKRRKLNDFDINIKFIVKNQLFPRLKFITSKRELDDCKNQIGTFIFKKYAEKHSKPPNRVIFWNNAKDSVSEAISEKRNAVQSSIKKKWFGK